MNILLMGCSFAVPNYNIDLLPSFPPEDHTQYRLAKEGYQVHNCGRNGGSNLQSLERAQKYIAGQKIEHPRGQGGFVQCSENNLKIDLVIWFHTEIWRDDLPKYQAVKTIYTRYKNFFYNLNCPYIIIGGAGDLDRIWPDYFSPLLVIPSWRRHILGMDLPLSNTLWSRNGITDNQTIDLEQKIKIIDGDLELIEKMKASPDFPDGCHPGSTPHKNLVDQILNLRPWSNG